jgi:Uma2 family endonuclease
MSEPATLEFISNGISEDEVIFPPGDILSDWQEDDKYPNVIVEILSSSKTAVDKGLKKQVYQDTFRTPDYF